MTTPERRFDDGPYSDAHKGWPVWDREHELGGDLQPVVVAQTAYVAEQVALALEVWMGSPWGRAYDLEHRST